MLNTIYNNNSKIAVNKLKYHGIADMKYIKYVEELKYFYSVISENNQIEHVSGIPSFLFLKTNVAMS